MSFVSFEFAIFVAICLFFYYILPHKIRWCVLLVASMTFYAICSLKYIVFILVTIITVYVSAILIENISVKQKEYLKDNKESLNKEQKKTYKNKCKAKQKLIIALCVMVNFGILFFIKYVNTVIAYFNYYRLTLWGNTNYVSFLNVFLPLGISFYTFSTIGYLVDVFYEKNKAERNIFKLALFTSFFPHIVQGPISRYNDLKNELFYKRTKFDFNNIKSGFYRVVWGLFKKLIIADRVRVYVDSSMDFMEHYQGGYILLGVFFYAFMIYSDFSGGIDITIGVSEMFGISLKENFVRPFFSKSISEYWARWHITLGTWFKDYIFYPLSVNKTLLKVGKWFRNHKMSAIGKRIPIYIPMIAVWALTGMWHGSQMRYVYWGLLNCIFIILGTEFKPLSEKIMGILKINDNMFFMKFYRVFKTFWLMSFLRLFDINDSVAQAQKAFIYIFRGWRDFSFSLIPDRFVFTMEDLYISFIGIAILILFDLIQRKGSVRERIFKLPVYCQWLILSALIIVTVLFGAYGLNYDAASFVYMQF